MTQPTPKINIGSDDSPPASIVNKFHANSDSDTQTNAQHHTLGIGHDQASPGDHLHNGKSSKRIGVHINPTFPTTAAAAYNQAQIQSIIDALRALGLGT